MQILLSRMCLQNMQAGEEYRKYMMKKMSRGTMNISV